MYRHYDLPPLRPRATGCFHRSSIRGVEQQRCDNLPREKETRPWSDLRILIQEEEDECNGATIRWRYTSYERFMSVE
ncbi:unnamed protein product [Ectocarpus sp. 6 AP-2014]